MPRSTYDVVVVGGGFGGAVCARRLERLLRKEGARVLLVAQENFLLFSPLLPEAAAGTLEPRHAVVPLRESLRRTDVLVGDVTAIALDAKAIELRDLEGELHTISFDTLVLAPGSVPATLPIPGLAEHAVRFKTLADAFWLRNHVFCKLEAASATDDPARRRQLLTFTFVGGGFAGVEALAELQSMVTAALRHYPGLQPTETRWVLVEAADRLLPGLDPRLARYTQMVLEERGVEVRLGTRLVSCEDAVVALSDVAVEPYSSPTIVWTTGQRPSPVVDGIGLDLDERGRVKVDARLQAAGCSDVYALGDCAAVPDPDGGLCPPTAQHALRQARVCAANIAADRGRGKHRTFNYRTRGLAVTLGMHQGAAVVKGVPFTGFLAWFLGRSYHLRMMPGVARKARVVSDWTIGLLFPRDTSQLGSLARPGHLPGPPPVPAAAPARRRRQAPANVLTARST